MAGFFLIYDLSNDAQSLVFVELSNGQGRNSAIYLRKTDGSPAYSWDRETGLPFRQTENGWRASTMRGELYEFDVASDRPGESHFAKIEGKHFDGVEWFPDNRPILFTGNETGHGTRSSMSDLETNKSTPVTPEGIRGMRVSPDGQWFITVDPHKLLLSPVGGGNSKTVVDLQERVSCAGAMRAILFLQRDPTSIKISRLDIATHRKEPWLVVKVPEPGAQFLGRWLYRPTEKRATHLPAGSR